MAAKMVTILHGVAATLVGYPPILTLKCAASQSGSVPGKKRWIYDPVPDNNSKNTVNDLINIRGVYLILGVQARAFKIERRLFS